MEKNLLNLKKTLEDVGIEQIIDNEFEKKLHQIYLHQMDSFKEFIETTIYYTVSRRQEEKETSALKIIDLEKFMHFIGDEIELTKEDIWLMQFLNIAYGGSIHQTIKYKISEKWGSGFNRYDSWMDQQLERDDEFFDKVFKESERAEFKLKRIFNRDEAIEEAKMVMAERMGKLMYELNNSFKWYLFNKEFEKNLKNYYENYGKDGFFNKIKMKLKLKKERRFDEK